MSDIIPVCLNTSNVMHLLEYTLYSREHEVFLDSFFPSKHTRTEQERTVLFGKYPEREGRYMERSDVLLTSIHVHFSLSCRYCTIKKVLCPCSCVGAIQVKDRLRGEKLTSMGYPG